MPANIMSDLSTIGRVTDHGDLFHIEMLNGFGEIVSILIHGIATPGLSGTAVTAAIMSDDTIALLSKKQHLRVPRVGAKRPTMREGDDRASSPVLVEDEGAIFGLEHI